VTEDLFRQCQAFFDLPEHTKLRSEVSTNLPYPLQSSREFLNSKLTKWNYLSVNVGTACITQAIGSRGYTVLGEQTLDPGKQKKGDTKESFYICSKSIISLTKLFGEQAASIQRHLSFLR
jgi:isopenicillin N synthase-like dioxygenase